jgi:hypothetical protein
MSEALTRVIDEQQKRIDDLLEGKLIERAANVFKKNDDLFEEVAKLIDCRITPDGLPEKEWEAYRSQRHEVRMAMIEAGYCVTCYNWMAHCECEDQYD